MRIRKQLLNLAESPLRRWHDEVLGIANMVAENYEDEAVRNNFVDLVLQLVVEQPLKTPFAAAVVLVTNTTVPADAKIVDDLLAKAAAATEEKIKLGEWRDVKLYLKFLACIQGCLEGDGVFPVLEELFARAVDLQTANSDDVSLIAIAAHFVLEALVNKAVYRPSVPSLLRSSCSLSHTSYRPTPPNGYKRLQISWKRPRLLPQNRTPCRL